MEQQRTDLARSIAALRRNGRLILVAVLVTTIASLLYSYRGAEVYSASSRVVLRPVLVEGVVTPQDALEGLQDPFAMASSIETQSELALGEDVSNRVALSVPASVRLRTSVTTQPVTDEILEIRASARDPAAAVRVANAYAEAFLETRRALVRNAFLEALDNLDLQIDMLQARIDSLQAQRDLYPPESQLESNRRAELRSLSSQITTLSQRRDQRALASESVSGGGDVISAARSASVAGPTPVRDAIVGAFLGLALGIGLALVRANSDRRVFTRDAAAEATGVEVLAAVPKNPARTARVGKEEVRIQLLGRAGRGNGRASGSPPILGELRFPSRIGSSFSILREALVARGLADGVRRVVLLSPEPGEGSALATGGLAWACAQAGLRTIAIDGALGPAEQEPLFASHVQEGLARVLTGTIGATDPLLATSVPGLRVLPAGQSRHQHDDALASHRPHGILDMLARHADLVIVRSPAASSGGDAVAWASEADAILLVLRAGVSRPGAAGRASRSLLALGFPLVGVVLTDTSAGDGTIGLSDRAISLETGWPASGDGHGSVAAVNEPRAAPPKASTPGRAGSGRTRRR